MTTLHYDAPWVKVAEKDYRWTCPICQREFRFFTIGQAVSHISNHLVSHDLPLPLLATCLKLVHDRIVEILSQAPPPSGGGGQQ